MATEVGLVLGEGRLWPLQCYRLTLGISTQLLRVGWHVAGISNRGSTPNLHSAVAEQDADYCRSN